jgi:hypothetical protein
MGFAESKNRREMKEIPVVCQKVNKPPRWMVGANPHYVTNAKRKLNRTRRRFWIT